MVNAMFRKFKKNKKISIDELERRVKKARQEAVEVARKSGHLKELADDMLGRIAERQKPKGKAIPVPSKK